MNTDNNNNKIMIIIIIMIVITRRLRRRLRGQVEGQVARAGPRPQTNKLSPDLRADGTEWKCAAGSRDVCGQSTNQDLASGFQRLRISPIPDLDGWNS